MTENRGVAVSWALGLGVLLASVAGTVVSSQTPAEEIRRVAGFALLFVPALYVMIIRERDRWSQKHPFVRFVVLFIGGFASIALLVLLSRTLLGGFDLVTEIAEFLAAVAGFGIAAWLGLYGGGEHLWSILVDRLDLEW